MIEKSLTKRRWPQESVISVYAPKKMRQLSLITDKIPVFEYSAFDVVLQESFQVVFVSICTFLNAIYTQCIILKNCEVPIE